MSDDNPTQPTQTPDEAGAEPVPREDLTEEVHTQASAEERRAKRWSETKGDLKWAAVALFVLYAIFAVIWQYTGWQRPTTGTEDIDAVAVTIFSPEGLVAPFEILSVLLLAALIAGIAISLRDPLGGEEMAAWRAEQSQQPSLEEREA